MARKEVVENLKMSGKVFAMVLAGKSLSIIDPLILPFCLLKLILLISERAPLF